MGVVARGESTNLAINGSDNDVAAVRGPLEIENIFTQRGSQPYAIQRQSISYVIPHGWITHNVDDHLSVGG